MKATMLADRNSLGDPPRYFHQAGERPSSEMSEDISYPGVPERHLTEDYESDVYITTERAALVGHLSCQHFYETQQVRAPVVQ